MRRHRKLSYLVGGDAHHGGHRLGVNGSAVLGDGTTVVTAGRDGTLRVWPADGSTGSNASSPSSHPTAQTISAHAEAVMDVCAVPNTEKAFLSCSADHHVTLHEGELDALHRQAHSDVVRRVHCSSPTLAWSGGFDSVVAMFDVEKELAYKGKFTVISAVYALKSCETLCFVGGECGGISVMDSRTAGTSNVHVVKAAHKDVVRDILVADSTRFVSCGSDGLVKLWDRRCLRQSVHHRIHTDSVWALSEVPGASVTNTILTGGRDGFVRCLSFSSPSPKAFTVADCTAPVLSLLTTAHDSRLFVSSTLSDVLVYDLWDFGLGELAADISVSTQASDVASAGLLTPSRIHLRTEEPEYEPLLEVDVRSFMMESLAPRAFATKEAKQKYCSSDLKHRAPPAPSPKSVLRGASAVVQYRLLKNRRHVVAEDDSGHLALYDLLTRTCTHRFDDPSITLDEAVKKCESPIAYSPSWCSVECRLGLLCVTLSSDEVFQGTVSPWELSATAPLTPPESSLAQPRSRRQKYRGAKAVNLGDSVVKALFRTPTPDDACFVWTAYSTNNANEVHPLGYRLYIRSFEESLEDPQVPSWVHGILGSEGPPAVAASKVSYELVPSDGLGALDMGMITSSRTTLLGTLMAEMCQRLKLRSKIPTVKSVLEESKAAANKSNGSGCAVAAALLALPADGEDYEGPLLPEEYLDIHEEGGQSLDPLLSIGAACAAYKQKGKSNAVLYYRVRSWRLPPPS